MFNLKFPLLILFLIPYYLIAQIEVHTIETRLHNVKSMLDSAQYDKAIELSRQILFEYQVEGEKSDTTEAKIYNAISSVFVKTAKHDSAIYYANKALGFLNDNYKDHFERSKSFNYLGASYHQLAKFDQAIKSLNKGLEIVKRTLGEDHFEATTFYGNLSLCYNEIGEPQKAIHYLEKNLDILLELYGENHINVAKSYNNLGAVYYKLGDYDKVLDYSFKTLKIKRQLLGDHHPSVGSTYLNIGSMSMEKGDYEKGKAYIEKALLILQESLRENHPVLIIANKILGSCYKRLRNYPKAIEHYEKGIAITQSNYGKNHYRAGGIYHNLGDLYRKIGKYEKANKYANKALKIFLNNQSNNKEVAASYESLGSINNTKGEYDKAIEQYEKALQFYANQSLKGPDRAIPYMGIGVAYSHKSKFLKAGPYFDNSARALQYDFNQPTNFDQVSDRFLLRILLNKKRIYYEKLYQNNQNKKYLDSIQQNDQHAIALEDYFQSELSEQEARTFHSSDAYWRYEVAIKNLFLKQSTEDLRLAFEVAEKSRSRLLTESFRSVEAKKIAGISQELLDKESQVNIELSLFDKKLYQEQYETETPNDSLIKVYTARLFQINQQREELVQTFRAEYPAYHRLKYDHSTASISDIQSVLQNDQALLEYFVGDSTIFIFVITPDSYHVKSIEKDFPLEEWVKTLRESIYSYWMLGGQSDEIYQNQNSAYAKVAFQLYEKLVLPIQTMLPEVLIIVPDGALNYVPFEALLSEIPKNDNSFKDHSYLLKQHQISYNYSATLLKELAERNNADDNNSLLAFAPSFKEDSLENGNLTEIRGGFGHLKYNVEEAKAVQSLIGGDLFIGDQATENQFLQIANLYQIIHLSTHGKSNDLMGDYSFVAFSEVQDSITDNERLYVRELYNMQLNAEMVVLSACETGLGEMKRGEGIIGLARGFTYAGAASTVTSLWSVNDIQTTHLMTRFYENIKAGMTKDAALRQAKLSFIKEESHADPYFWSAFVAAGNMAPIDFKRSWPWWYYGILALGMLGVFYLFQVGIFRKKAKI